MNEKKQMKISVRNLVEFILRSGDLDNRFTGSIRAVEGTRAHQKVQRSRGEEYQSEVTLSRLVEGEDFLLQVEGRADGIFTLEKQVYIDEIKSTVKPLEVLDKDYNPLHWAQAKCYAYIYAEQNRQNEIGVQLSYFQLETEEIRQFREVYNLEELKVFFTELTSAYLSWAGINYDWINERNSSIKEIAFPFPAYREGQRKMAVAAYRTITEGKRIFIQAPTGIGKTISVLFPSVKALAEGYGEKIFYLTAKTITRKTAEETLNRLIKQGLKLKYITLTAKDKICFLEKAECNPDVCPYARGHFDRVNEALKTALQSEEQFDREMVEKFARKYQLCPFEFSLDLSLWVDCIIGDYNYVFDPRVSLKRFFSEKGEYIFLIDEAHNLVERSREMFSTGLNSALISGVKTLPPADLPLISRGLEGLKEFFLSKGKLLNKKGELIEEDAPEEIYPLVRQLITGIEEWLIKENVNTEGYEDFLEFYFQLLALVRIADLYDERYLTFFRQMLEGGWRDQDDKKGIEFRLYCLDPSFLLGEVLSLGRAAVLFSATLTPLDYFRTLLGGDENDYLLELPSPFPAENHRLLLATNISTRYRDREAGLAEVAHYIRAVSQGKAGNYLVFFPSYQYLTGVVEIFNNTYPEVRTIIQEPVMNENEREKFLKDFLPENKETLIGFAVLGGIFGEGIDLKGERLLGTVIVGIGHPRICLERNILRGYFNKQYGLGYEYAYIYPGINKVLQAAGRTIRSGTDRGVTLLIGDRFADYRYRKLLPADWQRLNRVFSPDGISSKLQEFWENIAQN